MSSGVGLHSPALTLNENQVLYLFSTSAQVIAAIYGLTLIGFLFFRNELNREATKDETLTEAIDQLKKTLLFFARLHHCPRRADLVFVQRSHRARS